jgi:flagellar biosynthesis/type III secretory pathway chaperone
METLLTELISIVRQEIDHYRQLLALVRRERGRIVRGELAGLVEVVRRKEALAKQLTDLEASRMLLLARVANELAEDAATVTLARAAAMARDGGDETLGALVAEFRGVVGQLVAANDVNRTLLDRSLECVHGSLELFRPVASGPSTYGAGGRAAGLSTSLAVVNHTA